MGPDGLKLLCPHSEALPPPGKQYPPIHHHNQHFHCLGASTRDAGHYHYLPRSSGPRHLEVERHWECCSFQASPPGSVAPFKPLPLTFLQAFPCHSLQVALTAGLSESPLGRLKHHTHPNWSQRFFFREENSDIGSDYRPIKIALKSKMIGLKPMTQKRFASKIHKTRSLWSATPSTTPPKMTSQTVAYHDKEIKERQIQEQRYTTREIGG